MMKSGARLVAYDDSDSEEGSSQQIGIAARQAQDSSHAPAAKKPRSILSSQRTEAPQAASPIQKHSGAEPSAAEAVKNPAVVVDEYQRTLQEKVDEWRTLPPTTETITSALLKHRQFRNPNIVTKLIDYMQIQEYDSMLPKSQWDPSEVAGPDNVGWVDHLEMASTKREQQREMKQTQSQRTQIPFVPSDSTTSSSQDARQRPASQNTREAPSSSFASGHSQRQDQHRPMMSHSRDGSSSNQASRPLAQKIGAGAIQRIESMARDRYAPSASAYSAHHPSSGGKRR